MIDRELLRGRLVAAYEYLKQKGLIHSKSDLARAVGIRVNNLNDAFGLRGNYMNEPLLTKIADTFPDVLNRDYLLKGEGDVAAPDRTMRPHYEATAAAGFMSGLADPESGTLRPRIPDMPSYDFTITVSGVSMQPVIDDGDVLLCRRADDRANPPIDKVCVIDSRDGALVKIITRADGESISIHSYNPAYSDTSIDTSSVNALAVVVALLRRFND